MIDKFLEYCDDEEVQSYEDILQKYPDIQKTDIVQLKKSFIKKFAINITPKKQKKIFSVPSENDTIEGPNPYPNPDHDNLIRSDFDLAYLALFKKIKKPDEITRIMLVNLIQTSIIQFEPFEKLKERFFKTFKANIA